MKRLAFAVASLVATQAGAQPAPAIPPEVAAHIPRDVRPYFVGLLVSPPEEREMSRELFILHQAYMRRQFEAGIYRLAGPLTDGGRIHGMVILSAASIEEARAIVAADPAVREHVLDAEVHPAIFPNLAGLRVDYPPRP